MCIFAVEKCMVGIVGRTTTKMAAPSSAGRVLTLCKQFLNVVKISSAVNTRLCAANINSQSHIFR